MKIHIDKINEITTGVTWIEEKNGFVKFHRFSKEQEKYYERSDANCFFRVPATAGVKMHFVTDGNALKIKYKTELASSRTFFSLDVVIDGVYSDSADNFSNKTLIDEYPKQDFDLGYGEKTFIIGEGVKDVSVYFPWSVALELKEIDVSNATFINALKPRKKILFFGDSITQGYDAMRSFNRYAAQIADLLSAEEINKGIGGEGFAPDLAAICENYLPEYILVAYGTNDWSNSCFDDFKFRVKRFFANLNMNYPKSKVFVLSPIWRIDYLKNPQDWGFLMVDETLRSFTEEYKNITVINGFDLVPHERKFFSDDFNVHPNDLGFCEFSRNLIEKIK